MLTWIERTESVQLISIKTKLRDNKPRVPNYAQWQERSPCYYSTTIWNHQLAMWVNQSVHLVWPDKGRYCLSSLVSQLEIQEICWSGWQLVWHHLVHKERVPLGPLLGWSLPVFVGVHRRGASFQPTLLLAHSGDCPSNLYLQQRLVVCQVVASQICFLNLPVPNLQRLSNK